MAIRKKNVCCPQCRTEGSIQLLDKNAERTMYKCKNCRPFHVFTVLNNTEAEIPSPATAEDAVSGTVSTQEPPGKSRKGLITALVIVCAAVLAGLYFMLK